MWAISSFIINDMRLFHNFLKFRLYECHEFYSWLLSCYFNNDGYEVVPQKALCSCYGCGMKRKGKSVSVLLDGATRVNSTVSSTISWNHGVHILIWIA